MKNYLRFTGLVLVGFGTVGLVIALSSAERNHLPALAADWLGASGNLCAIIATPKSAHAHPQLSEFLPEKSLEHPGLYKLKFLSPTGEPVVFFSLIPFSAKKSKKTFRGYYMGNWPHESNGAASGRYVFPEGFIEVTAENQFTPVSKHFKLKDFLPHDQKEVWPKFMVLRAALLDKLELIINELEQKRKPSRLHIMSGFRTPQYNAEGVGKGRASNSQHIYGNAADIYVDANGDHKMDDLDNDGKSTAADAQYLFGLIEKIESDYPQLAGGLSIYRATSAHGPFLHVDARGASVRW